MTNIKDMITKAKAKKAQKEFNEIMRTYDQHIIDLQDQEHEWRKMAWDPTLSAKDRAFARYQVTILAEMIYNTVRERSQFMMRSF